MSVKAKFTCNSVIPNVLSPKAVFTYFNAVYGTEGENADYAKATPFGTITMGIDDTTPAAEFFQVGKNYIVTFEESI